MLKWLSILVSVIFLFTAPVFAQDTYEVYRLPEGRKVVSVDDGDTYMGYTLGQFNELLVIDNDLRLSEGLVKMKGQIIVNQDKIMDLQERATKITEHSLEIVSDDRDRITEKWKADNKALHKAQNKPFINVNSWFVGTVIVETIVIVVLIGLISNGG